MIVQTLPTFVFFVTHLSLLPKGSLPTIDTTKLKKLLGIKRVNVWYYYWIEQDSSEDCVALKDFVDRLLEDCFHRLHTE